MICFKCGHLAAYHVPTYPVDGITTCNMCFKYRMKKSIFYRHNVENNLDYLERKAMEKPNVA